MRKPSSQKSLATAQQHHQAGHLEEAETLYRNILAQQPGHTDALCFLGLLKHQQGHPENALELIGKAIAGNPGIAHYHCNLALVLTGQAKNCDAVRAYRRALKLQPELAEAWYNLGILLREQGDLSEAAASFRKVIQLSPEFFPAHNSLGNALKDQGNTEEAITHYRRAIALKPDYTHAWKNLALAQSACGEHPSAVLSYRKLVDIQPRSPEAWLDLGMASTKADVPDEAIAAYQQAVILDPKHLKAWTLLGQVLQRQREDAAAIDAYREVLHLNPDSVDTLANLSNLLERTGQFEEALEHVERGLRLAPSNSGLAFTAASVYRQEGRITEAIGMLEHALTGKLPSEFAADIHHRLGQLFDRAGDIDKAFEQISTGGHISLETAHSHNIYKQTYLQRVDDLHRYFVDDLAQCAPAPADYGNEQAPVFLVGFPRSGTTLLEQFLGGHTQLQTLEERPVAVEMEYQFISSHPGEPTALRDLSSAEIETLRALYFRSAGQWIERDPGRLLIDKLPLNIEKTHLLWRVFPEAKFILAIRHPCDACLSCFMQYFAMNDAMANFCTLEDTVALYEKVMGMWRSYVDRLPIQAHTLRYEDLIDDPEGETRRLFEFLDLPWQDTVLDHVSTARARNIINTPSYHQVVQPIYQHARFRWQRYQQHFDTLLPRLQPYIDYFGYGDWGDH